MLPTRNDAPPLTSGDRARSKLVEHLIGLLGLDDYKVNPIFTRYAGLDPAIRRALEADRFRSIPSTACRRGWPMTAACQPITLTCPYETISQRGTRYFAGRLGLARITPLRGDPTKDGTPTWRLLLQEAPKSQASTAIPVSHSPLRPPRTKRQSVGHGSHGALRFGRRFMAENAL
jgi:hypothetical protein